MMIPTSKDTSPITTNRETTVDDIFDWFEHHQHLFYKLGWSLLGNQQQMEELFYRSILKVYKELPRSKRNSSFETWVAAIFFQIYRELYHNKSLVVLEKREPGQGLVEMLGRLQQDEKEALVLTYVNKFPKEETADLLRVSKEKLNELLFSGIQSLRKKSFNGCKEYQKDYINYLERTMERPEKIEFEIHVYHCPNCQEDLGTFQEVMLDLASRTEELHMPPDFMGKVKDRLQEKEKQRHQKNKKRKRTGLVFVGVFALFLGIGFFTGLFSNLYYTWTEEDQELRSFLQQNLSERLNLEDENNGVKIRIKGAVSDDVQTLVYYEIEDTGGDNQYIMNYGNGVAVENEHQIMNRELNQRYIPPNLESELNNKEKNVYHGKISLLPLSKDNGTIKLKITRLQQLIPDAPENDLSPYGNMQQKRGEWNFEIPVTKLPSTEYSLDERTKVEGISVRFEKLTIAPTATILQYAINNEQQEKSIDGLNFDSLEVNNSIAKADLYGSSFMYSQPDLNWTVFQAHFDPLFGEKPKDVSVHLQSAQLTFNDQKNIELDASQEYPQTFEYAGSTISIDKVEVGVPSEVVISDHDTENRSYQSLHFDIESENETEPRSMEIHTEGVLVDKNGITYDINKNPVTFEEIEQPRYFITVERVMIHDHDSVRGNKVIPVSLNIYGYTSLKYLDNMVKISLE